MGGRLGAMGVIRLPRLLLRPLRLARLVGSSVVTEESSILPFVGWTKGRLVFRNATLPEVAARLERWYGLEVKIQDPSLRDLQLTANLRSQALGDVLDIVAASLRIEYRIEEGRVLLIS